MKKAGTTFPMSTLTRGGSWSSFVNTVIRNITQLHVSVYNIIAPCFCASDHLNNATVKNTQQQHQYWLTIDMNIVDMQPSDGPFILLLLVTFLLQA